MRIHVLLLQVEFEAVKTVEAIVAQGRGLDGLDPSNTQFHS